MSMFYHFPGQLLPTNCDLTQALDWIPQCSRPKKISFSGESPVFTQSDMDESNFFIDANGEMCLGDFKSIGLLPESFASYTMYCYRDPFVIEVAKYLDWSRSPNLYSMARACEILQKMGDPTLGMSSTSTCHRILTNNGDRLG